MHRRNIFGGFWHATMGLCACDRSGVSLALEEGWRAVHLRSVCQTGWGGWLPGTIDWLFKPIAEADVNRMRTFWEATVFLMNYRCIWNDPFIHVSGGPLTVFFPAVMRTRVGSLSHSRQQLFKTLCSLQGPELPHLLSWKMRYSTTSLESSDRPPPPSLSSTSTLFCIFTYYFYLEQDNSLQRWDTESLITCPPVSSGSMTSKLSPGLFCPLPSPFLFFFFFWSSHGIR